nr:hypothetical protein [Paraglaciecola sp. T6c]
MSQKVNNPSIATFSSIAHSHSYFAQATSISNQIAFLGLGNKFYLKIFKFIVGSNSANLLGKYRSLNKLNSMTHRIPHC